MRTVSYRAAVSLDGFLAASHGSIDWLHHGKQAQDIMLSADDS